MQRPVYPSYQAPPPVWRPAGGLSPKAYGEKQGIQRAALGIGIAFVLFFGVQVLLGVFSGVVAVVNGGDIDFLYEPGFLWAEQVVLSALCFTLPFVLSVKVCHRRVGDVVRLEEVGAGLFIPLVAVGLGMCMLGNYATEIMGSTLSSFGLVPSQPSVEDPSGWLGVCMTILSTAFLPALVEEFAFRGVILGLLRPYGDGFAIAVSAVLFGVMHGNLVQAPFAVLVGLGLGYITVVSRSMWPAIVAHFLNNFLAVTVGEWMGGLSPTSSALVNNLYAIVLFAAGFAGLAFLLKKRPNLFRLNPSPCELTAGKRFGAFAAQPLIVLSLCAFALTMVVAQISF